MGKENILQLTLKLFSLGFLLIIILNVSYTSSVPLWMVLAMSCWYWLGSKKILNVLESPLSLGLGSGPAYNERHNQIKIKKEKS